MKLVTNSNHLFTNSFNIFTNIVHNFVSNELAKSIMTQLFMKKKLQYHMYINKIKQSTVGSLTPTSTVNIHVATGQPLV